MKTVLTSLAQLIMIIERHALLVTEAVLMIYSITLMISNIRLPRCTVNYTNVAISRYVVTELICGIYLSIRYCEHSNLSIIIIIIRQPLCPVVGRRPQHVVSK